MAANTVEATLRSKFEDGISRGVENTQKLLASTFASMRSAGAVGSAAFQGVFDAALGSLESYRQRLQQASEESQTSFGKMGFAAAAFTTVLIAGFLKAGKAVADFFFDLVKESSKALEVKIAFENLTASLNLQADVIQDKLKRATEGQIASTVLLQNANRILQSHVPITIDQYAKLTENVFRLSKAAGADTSQAINTLTDAIVRGNSRGLQAFGVHVAVRDAISAMAEATGQATAKLADDSRMRAFYNELLQKTEQQVQSLGPAFLTVEDIITQAEVTWKGFIISIGQAIGRSGVLQELLQRVSGGLLEFGASKESLDGVTLATNRFLISALHGFASVIEILGALRTAWDAVYGFIKAATEGLFIVVSGFLYYFTAVFGYLFSWAAKVPGIGPAVRSTLQALAGELFDASRRFAAIKAEFEKDPAFGGFGEGQQKLNALANSARALAAEMEKYSAEVKRGAAGTTDHGAAAAKAAAQQKELNEQLQKYADLRRELAQRTATPEQAALMQLMQDFEKIGQLTLVSEERRNQLKIQALLAYDAKRREIESRRNAEEVRTVEDLNNAVAQATAQNTVSLTEQTLSSIGLLTNATETWWAEFTAKMAREREQQRKREVDESISAANTIAHAVEMARKGKIARSIGSEAFGQIPDLARQLQQQIRQIQEQGITNPDQLEQLFKLYEALDRLNRLNMTPLKAMLGDLRLSLETMAQATTEAFASFWADMVSGQENAGKRFLAALLNMVANELLVRALRMTALAIEHAAMLDFAGAARYAAAAAGISALAGILKGFAATLSQPSQSGAGSTAQNDVSRPTSSTQVPVIDVGAARGAQNPGQAAAQPLTGEITLRIEPKRDFIVREVKSNIKGNRALRTVIQNA